jgi:hypothetical protein
MLAVAAAAKAATATNLVVMHMMLSSWFVLDVTRPIDDGACIGIQSAAAVNADQPVRHELNARQVLRVTQADNASKHRRHDARFASAERGGAVDERRVRLRTGRGVAPSARTLTCVCCAPSQIDFALVCLHARPTWRKKREDMHRGIPMSPALMFEFATMSERGLTLAFVAEIFIS